MESSTEVHIPVRSISLPSRLYPNSHKIETQLNNLKAYAAATISSNAEAIELGLFHLEELYNCLQELIQSPLTQQALRHHRNSNLVEEALDGSVGLLDVCSTARDLFLAAKEHVHDLQSVLRRKGGRSLSIECHIKSYIVFRKKMKKEIVKSLKALKRIENSSSNIESYSYASCVCFVSRVFGEVRTLTCSILRSLMIFLSGPEMKTTTASKWSLVSKLLISSESNDKMLNEFGEVDVAVDVVHGQTRRKSDDKFDVQDLQNRLERLDESINGLEAKLDRLFRCVIQNRVALLNISMIRI